MLPKMQKSEICKGEATYEQWLAPDITSQKDFSREKGINFLTFGRLEGLVVLRSEKGWRELTSP